jgi:hypothetical protein
MGHVEDEMRKAYKIWLERLKGSNHLKDQGTVRRIISEQMNWNIVDWIHLVQ